MPDTILHITTPAVWAAAQQQGLYETPSLADEGFIHFSTPEQAAAVANYVYPGRKGLILLCVDPGKLTSELRYEALGTEEAYPHLYGSLNLDAVVRVIDFSPDANGLFGPPPGVSSSVS